MKRNTIVASLALLIALTGGVAMADKDGDGGKEVQIPLKDVPEAAMKAAVKAVAGFVAKSASMEREEGKTIYEIKGEAAGVKYEIEVTADGQVIEIEKGGDDDKDDDNDDKK